MNFPLLSPFRSAAQLLLSSSSKGQTVFSVANIAHSRCFVAPLPSLQTVVRWKSEDRRVLIQSTPLKDMGTQGEKQLDVDLVTTSSKENLYPDAETPDLIFDGVRYAELLICHIKSSKNNTHIHFTDHKGEHLVYRTCGLEGFKNTRKGTNIAAQTTAVTISSMVQKKGVRNIRVKIQGLGPGRMSAVKGLQMSGMNVVSVTDCTPISFNPPRPRKVRRL